ncbi:hypothetical protein PHYPSEUDO_011858 [Phytophthora pseudosyringae]|uniref:Uncharacterized protein n=1 Tax=Phytophthora pseudosyringae TaxID=221518 RepID=A0A8T1VB57_9STRA|nr:hypothetical protein PHYPSEUDO_011858 [Phytophthora pseudosyringae]
MGKSINFEMRVVLENGAYFSYLNPSERMCITFADCDNWKPAKSVFWRNLPAQGSVDFYQSNDCSANDGDVYAFTGKQTGSGLHTFKTPRAIRSMYARPLWGNYPWHVARRCVQLRLPAKRAESTLLSNGSSDGEINETEWTNVGSVEEDGTSSNWFDPTAVGEKETL